jgi:glycolate oxidase iron-sulfur subunit
MATATEQLKKPAKLHSLLEANSDKLLTCVHCGLCLPSCPTYRALGNENDSPRGRIYLMRSLVEGRIEIGDSFTNHIDLCLGCRACETACPSGVPYGQLLETARAEIVEAHAEQRTSEALLVAFVLKQIFTRPRMLAAAMKLAKWFRDSGLAELAFASQLFTGRLRFGLAVLLSSRSPFAAERKTESDDLSALTRAATANVSAAKLSAQALPSSAGETVPSKIRLGVLRGCVMEGLFTEANRATERVLMRNGCQLAAVQKQMCCGALHAHAGHMETARELARKNIKAFLEEGCEAIIVNSAGCGAAMKEYGDWLEEDKEFAAQAAEFSAKVKDVSEFLAARGITRPQGHLEACVTYDAPCHLMHAQRIVNPPVELLQAIPGLRFTALAGAETCCGGAGIYNLQHPELSAEILSGKLENIRRTGADMVATANPGCIMQIGAGAKMAGLDVKVVHPVELLDAAYKKG